MQADTYGREAETRPAEVRTVPRHRLRLTTDELRQLGLFRVGYLTRAASAIGNTDIIIHGADGVAITMVDSVELAMNLAGQHGLAVVPVH